MSQRVVIYGGYGGIGQATGRRLSETGASLHLVGLHEAKVKSAAAELGASYTVGDVRDEDLFGKVGEDFAGPWSGLVYAVGTINLKGLARLTTEDFLNDYQVNALGAVKAVQAGLKAMKASSTGASVVLFSSVAASRGFNFHTSISMAKGAVNGLGLALAAELAPKIRVNVIAPSLTKTPLAEGILANPKMAESLAGLHPLQRLGEAEDIGELAAFLISDRAAWMTGQVIGVDGGRAAIPK